MKNKIVVVIAAYNEEEKIADVVGEVVKFANKIVVVDDGSKDRTGEVIKNDKVIVLKHVLNLGQGAALQTGFDYAKTLNPEVIVTYDADGQFLAEEIPIIIDPILKKKVDVVLGSRFLGKVVNLSGVRRIILKMGIFFTYAFSGLNLTDTHNGFRAFSGKAIKKINLNFDRMAHASEIIDQIKRNNLSFCEVPVTVKYDDYSKRKGQKNSNAIKIVMDLIYANILAR